MGMEYWCRLQAWFQDNHGYDEYGVSAYNKLVEVRKYCYKRYGSDGDIVYEQIGKRLQYHIDAMNNQGGLRNHKHALARWQIYKALYPQYVSDEPPKIVRKVWLNPRIQD